MMMARINWRVIFVLSKDLVCLYVVQYVCVPSPFWWLSIELL